MSNLTQGENVHAGKKNPQTPLFYYFNMSEMVPKNHILRLINKYVDFSFIRDKVKHLYSGDIGRPSIDPEILIRMLLISYLYNITSERKLCEEVKMHTCLPTGRLGIGGLWV